jgi:hypothetical protein
VTLPKNMTDITTAATIIQLAVPHLKLVLDPMLFLKAAPKPKGIPKVIHMTLRSKHSLAPHQILSIVSWGWYVNLCLSVSVHVCCCCQHKAHDAARCTSDKDVCPCCVMSCCAVLCTGTTRVTRCCCMTTETSMHTCGPTTLGLCQVSGAGAQQAV